MLEHIAVAEDLAEYFGKYNHWIDTIYEGEVLVVDKDHEDFVSNPAVLERICARLDALKAKK